LRTAQWNANGIQQHKEEVKLFLKRNLIDILLVSETHFSYKNHYFIPGYDLCYTCHPDGTAHGGTAFVIKNTLEYYEGPKYAEAAIQATSVTVSGLFHKITIAAVYCPPRHNLQEEHFKTFFQTLGPRFLAGGGFQQ
jgi:exonuclease III